MQNHLFLPQTVVEKLNKKKEDLTQEQKDKITVLLREIEDHPENGQQLYMAIVGDLFQECALGGGLWVCFHYRVKKQIGSYNNVIITAVHVSCKM